MTVTETSPVLVADPGVAPSAVPLRPALPVLLLTAGVVVGLSAAHGGYFATSWGLGATILLWSTGLWLVLSGRTDAGWVDVAFLALLGGLASWIGLSIAWSHVPAQTVLELERTSLVLAGMVAFLVLTRREDVPRLAGVLLASIVAVCAYALATRLFPERLGSYDPIAGARLSQPIGYWNALGVFADMGALLALGIASDARERWARVGAAVSLVVLCPTLYFTYSRGAWLALAIGTCVLVAVTPRRLRTIVTAAVLAVAPATAVVLASSSYELTHIGVPLARAKDAGHGFAVVLALLLVAAGALALLLDVAQRRIVVPRTVRLAFGSAFAAAVVGVAAGVVVHFGGPVTMARDAWRAFEGPPRGGTDLDARLFSFSGNGRAQLWRVAHAEYTERPLAGDGAGTFERRWQANADAEFKVRDAHSLYVETLAELGTVGLALVALLFLLPLAVGLAVRRSPFLPGVLAAFAAFVVHAGVDWDWELSAVTLTALFVGALPLIRARRRASRVLRPTARTAGCVAVLLASIGTILAFLGNGALGRAEDAVATKSYAEAIDEADRARRLMPWSPWPLIARGDAEVGAGDLKAARRSFREAISIDRGEWRAWVGLAFATKGRTRLQAFQRARRLYPRSAEIVEAAARLGIETNG